MDVLDSNLLQLWKTLNECNVRYIMIGGLATRLHGFNRATDDLDLWLEDTSANRKSLRVAFNVLSYGDMPMLETMQFLPGWSSFHIGEGIELDILTSMKGLEQFSFTECLDMASIANIEDIKVPFLHINHLIANKMATNRPKDKIDVIELEKIKMIRAANEKQ